MYITKELKKREVCKGKRVGRILGVWGFVNKKKFIVRARKEEYPLSKKKWRLSKLLVHKMIKLTLFS